MDLSDNFLSNKTVRNDKIEILFKKISFLPNKKLSVIEIIRDSSSDT